MWISQGWVHKNLHSSGWNDCSWQFQEHRDWATGSGWNQHLICCTSKNRDIFREHSIQFMTDSLSIYLGRAFSSVTRRRWEGGRHKRKVESRAASDVCRQSHAAVGISILNASFIMVRGYSERHRAACIELFTTSLHLNLPRLCFHTKWRPFPTPTSVPEHSWAWQLEAEFAERWHGAWLGCSLDSCPDRRSAAQVLNRKQAKHCAGFPIGLSDKILRIWTPVLIFSIFIV